MLPDGAAQTVRPLTPRQVCERHSLAGADRGRKSVADSFHRWFTLSGIDWLSQPPLPSSQKLRLCATPSLNSAFIVPRGRWTLAHCLRKKPSWMTNEGGGQRQTRSAYAALSFPRA